MSAEKLELSDKVEPTCGNSFDGEELPPPTKEEHDKEWRESKTMKEKPIIESGIDIPSIKHGGTKWNQIVQKMKPGDSVLISTESISTGLRQAIDRVGFRAVCRKMENGYRVWLLNKNDTEDLK